MGLQLLHNQVFINTLEDLAKNIIKAKNKGTYILKESPLGNTNIF